MFTIITKVSCVVLLTFVISSGASKSSIKGAITDSEGAVIRGARVLVHWDRTGADIGLKSNVGIQQDLTLETNERGEFSVELPPGFYDVFVSAAAFSPECRKIRLKVGDTMIFKAKLKADPLVTKETGDRY